MLGKFVSIQFAVQALAALSGLLLVRVMSQREYAYFTIAASMLSTMALLADTGLSIGLSAIGGKVWQDPYKFGQLVATTMRLRRYLAAAAVAVVAPILLWMLISKGASFRYAGMIGVLVLAGFNYQLTTGVLLAVPRLLGQVSRIQRLDLFSALGRVLLLVVAYFVFLNAATAVLATVAVLGLQYVALRRMVVGGIDTHAPVDPEYRRTLLGIIKSGAPTTIFYCVQGQATVWVMSVFGNTQNVAEIGALGRLGIIFAVIGSVMTTIILPRFAKYASREVLERRFVQITGGFVTFGLALVAAAAVVPGVFLWILGSRYALLRHELLLMMVLTVVKSTAEAMWSLNASKAWIKHSWLNVPGTLGMQVLLVMLLDLSTLRGVLLFGIFSLVPSFLLNIVLAYRGLRDAPRPA